MIFKLKGSNLEFIVKGLKTEIRPIHKPKRDKWNKISPFG